MPATVPTTSARNLSIEGQIRECTAYAESKGITLAGSYIDRAISAKSDNRPEFQRMIQDSAKGVFDVIIVWRLDRFSRNRYDSAHYKKMLRKNGVKVISATEAISEGAEGILVESLLEGLAEYYACVKIGTTIFAAIFSKPAQSPKTTMVFCATCTSLSAA